MGFEGTAPDVSSRFSVKVHPPTGWAQPARIPRWPRRCRATTPTATRGATSMPTAAVRFHQPKSAPAFPTRSSGPPIRRSQVIGARDKAGRVHQIAEDQPVSERHHESGAKEKRPSLERGEGHPEGVQTCSPHPSDDRGLNIPTNVHDLRPRPPYEAMRRPIFDSPRRCCRRVRRTARRAGRGFEDQYPRGDRLARAVTRSRAARGVTVIRA